MNHKNLQFKVVTVMSDAYEFIKMVQWCRLSCGEMEVVWSYNRERDREVGGILYECWSFAKESDALVFTLKWL